MQHAEIALGHSGVGDVEELGFTARGGVKMSRVSGVTSIPRTVESLARGCGWFADYRVRVAQLFSVLPAILLVVVILRTIWTSTAHVPYWDEWDAAVLTERLYDGRLTLGDLWAPHGVHRILVPRVIDLGIITLTGWNRQIEMTVNLAIALGTCLLLASVANRTRTIRSRLGVFAATVLGSLVLLSLSQYANWFAPFQLAFLSAGFGVALCLWAVSRDHLSWGAFTWALAGALIASFSSFPGLMVWPAFLPQFLTYHERRKGILKGVLWIGVACEVVLVYLAGNVVAHDPALSIWASVQYILAYLGAPVGYPSVTAAMLLGVTGLVLVSANFVMYLRLGGDARRLMPWAELGFFAVLCSVSTAFGRAAVGVELAISSRYHIFAGLLWLVVIILTVMTVEQALSARPGNELAKLLSPRGLLIGANSAVLIMLGVGLVTANVAGMRDALIWQDAQRRGEGSVVDYANASDTCLLLYNPDPGMIRPLLAFLAFEHLALYAQPNAASSSPEHATAAGARATQTCDKPYHFID